METNNTYRFWLFVDKKSDRICCHKVIDAITLLELINQWKQQTINSHKSISDKSWDHFSKPNYLGQWLDERKNKWE